MKLPDKLKKPDWMKGAGAKIKGAPKAVGNWGGATFKGSPIGKTPTGVAATLAGVTGWEIGSAIDRQQNISDDLSSGLYGLFGDDGPLTDEQYREFFPNPASERGPKPKPGSAVPPATFVRKTHTQLAGGRPDGAGYTPNDRLAQGFAAFTQGIEQQRAALKGEYEQRVAHLKSRYDLAETREERQRLDAMKADLDAQANAGAKAIDTAYNEGIASNLKLAGETEQQATRDRDSTSKLYTDAAASIAAGNQQAAASVAGPDSVGMSMPTTGSASVAGDLTVAAGASQAALAGQLSSIDAQAQQYLMGEMKKEQAGQQGALQRQAQAVKSQAELQHAEQVNARIRQDRADMMNALDSLYGQTSGQLYDLDGMKNSAGLDLAKTEAQRADAFQSRLYERQDRWDANELEYQKAAEEERRKEFLKRQMGASSAGYMSQEGNVTWATKDKNGKDGTASFPRGLLYSTAGTAVQTALVNGDSPEETLAVLFSENSDMYEAAVNEFGTGSIAEIARRLRSV